MSTTEFLATLKGNAFERRQSFVKVELLIFAAPLMICFGTNPILFASGRALGNAKNVGVHQLVASKFGQNKIVSDIVGADLCT